MIFQKHGRAPKDSHYPIENKLVVSFRTGGDQALTPSNPLRRCSLIAVQSLASS
jgi:hypothetical protein